MHIFRITTLLSILCLLFAATGWAADAKPECIPPCPDYAKSETWASNPASPDKPVDVFYVYPTIYPGTSPNNMDVFDKDLRSAVQGLLKAQAGVYSSSANLYAPYYRQVSFACLDPKQDMMINRYFRIGADDVHRAFDYYLNFLNQGRPFILASHSQGSNLLTLLAVENRGALAVENQLGPSRARTSTATPPWPCAPRPTRSTASSPTIPWPTAVKNSPPPSERGPSSPTP